MEMAFDDKGNCVVLSEVVHIRRRNAYNNVRRSPGGVSIEFPVPATLIFTLRSTSTVELEFESDEAMHHEADIIMERMEKMGERNTPPTPNKED